MIMKPKKIIAMLLLIVFCASCAQTAVFAVNNYASWAAPYVKQADALGLLTENARKDYIKALSREEFCELVMTMYEKRTGISVPISSEPFNDTVNPLVLKAYSIGIIKGTSETTFSPNDAVTREQAAVMLVNTVRTIENVMGVVIYNEDIDNLPFEDAGQISSWALDAMKAAYANGLMRGDGVNVRPQANISCQECIILIINAYNKEETLPQDIGGGLKPARSPKPA
jgi:hypothetical protein